MSSNIAGIVEQFTGRDAGPLIQFIKYGIAGGIATVTHIVIFHILAWKTFPALQKKDPFVALLKLKMPELDDKTRARNSMICNCITFVISNLTAYLVNVFWVFEPGRHSPVVELALFYAVSLFTLAVGTALMGVLIKKYGWVTTYAFVSNIVVSILVNYAMRKFVIFKG